MPGVFDSKIFNAEVFKGYVDSVPNLRRNELIKSRAIRMRPELATSMQEQHGGNYLVTPLRGRIIGSAPQNYDGKTDMETTGINTFSHARVVVGRMKGWTENDFSHDITGGQDFMEDIAQQVAEYWSDVDQKTLLQVLDGVFSMKDAKGVEFVGLHTYDVTKKANSEGTMGHMDATTLNTAMQRACGDNKAAFTLAIMHSTVATNLENMKLLTYLKYNDANGMEREVGIGTINGRLVLVDDGMPSYEAETKAEVKGLYTITVSTAGVAGDTITVGDTTYTLGDSTSVSKKTLAVGSSESDQATALATLLTAKYSALFKVEASAATVKLTQLVGGTGEKPNVSVSGTLAAEIAETTPGVAREVTTAYTTYILGDGAIELTDCGAKVPYEVDRNPEKNGGQDKLYSRQRKSFAPYGISFTKKHMAGLSPTPAELQNGENWELVHSADEAKTEWLDHKAIPIARVLSCG